jgi:hypothetical protein
LAEGEPPELRADILLGALMAHNVRFVTVGGVAGQLHGASRLTKDLDICPAWNRENLELLAAALRDLDAVLRFRSDLEPTIVRPNPELLREISITLWRTPAGNIDILIGIPSARSRVIRFRELHERATKLELPDGTILVAALEDLIRAHEIDDRPKDRQALPELRALLKAGRSSAPHEAPTAWTRSAPDRPAQPGPSRYPPERHRPHRGGPTLGR